MEPHIQEELFRQIAALRKDVTTLLEKQARTEGKFAALTTAISIGVSAVVTLLGKKWGA